MFFCWILSDSKSSQVSRTLLSILDDLTNAAVWIVSSYHLFSKSSSPFTSPLVSVPRAPFIIIIIIIIIIIYIESVQNIDKHFKKKTYIKSMFNLYEHLYKYFFLNFT